MDQDDSSSASSLSEEEVDASHEQNDEQQNSWEEDSSSSDSSNNEGEEVEVEDSDKELLPQQRHAKIVLNQRPADVNVIVNDIKPAVQPVQAKRESSSSSSSGSGSGSGSSSGSSGSDSDEQPNNGRHPKKETKKVWEDNPDIYGIRRSNRARKEPQRLVIQSDSDDSNDSVKKRKSKGRRRKSENYMPNLSGSDTDDSGSSFDVPQRHQPPKRNVNRNVNRKRQQRGRGMSTSSDEFGKNFRSKKYNQLAGSGPKRNVKSKVSYKEDSEDETDSDDIIEQDELSASNAPVEDVETIEKVLRHQLGRPGVVGAQTTIYAVEAEVLSKLAEPDPDKEDVELQFLIKWKSWSHLHNTWESKNSLTAQKCNGMKKLENYLKRKDEVEQWKKNSTPEDVEYFELQMEMNEDIQKQFQKVERIIAHQFSNETASSYPDYLCKWGGLPYSDCTWEDGPLTARFFQTHIDQYLERENSDMIPNKNAKCLRHRPKFIPLKKQPDYLGNTNLQLRDYQLDGLNWIAHAWCREMSVILADEMGLGKTIQTISFLSYLFHTHHLYGPYLVVVPLSTMDAWQREFQLWAPDMNLIVYIGDVNSRSKIQEYEWCNTNSRKLKLNVLLTTYEMLLRDKELLGSLNWAALLVDEAHRLKNDDSLLYRVLIGFRTNFRLLITGTPLQNSLKELWSLMHFIMPNKFEAWEDFESQYSISDKEGLQKLHRDLEPYLLRRVKKDVEKSLPSKVEQILRMEMSTLQKQYYKLILTKNVKELCKELKGSFNGLLNIIVELKKCCNHSNLIKPLDPTTDDPNLLQTLIKGSGKMILLDKLLSRLKETGHRVLIFSQMVRMLDIIADYLYLKRFSFQRLDGSIRGEQRKRALDHFNAEGSLDFCFLLSTRAGGLGINLATADTVIIFDSDWNPQNDLQAMARAHRIGQKNQVNIYRFVTKNTIEEDIIERAKKKMVLDHLIIQRMDTTGRRILSKSNTTLSASAPFNKDELSSILKFGAEDLFKDSDADSDQKLHAMDIDDILKRAETQETQENSAVGEELLSQFKVVNYAAFNEEEIKVEQPNPMQKLWEEIIPEEDRKRIEEELEREKKAELTLKPRSRKTVEKMNVSQPTKKVKSKAIVDTDSSSSSSSDDEEEGTTVKEKKSTTKKRTKANTYSTSGVQGFTDAEIRRFIKSYKKFSRPLSRLDSIAEDGELTDKSTIELKNLGELLKSSCEQAVKEYQEKLLLDEQFDGKKKGASLKISGVTINAPSVLKSETDLEPLASSLPSDAKQQKSYRLTLPTRSVHWGIPWGVVEDSMLLIGMLIYGVGNWDAIKNDQSLSLTSKILPVGNGKPQNKHLQARADYLLKILKEQQNNQSSKMEPKKKKKGKPEKTKSEKTKLDKKGKKIENPVSPVSEAETTKSSTIIHDEKPAKKKNKREEITLPKEKKEKTKKKEKKSNIEQVSSPVVNEEAVVIKDSREDMEESTFKKCKEKMRPEKKSLQLLQTPDETLSPQEQVQMTKKCLLKIGDHIEKCLDEYNDQPSELDRWRSNLWSFVAKFTELGPAKLHKLYRTAFRKRDAQVNEKKKEIQKLKANHSTTLYEMGKNVPSDRLEMEEARKRALGLNKQSSVAKIPQLNKIKIPHKREKPPTNNNQTLKHTMEKSHGKRSNYEEKRGKNWVNKEGKKSTTESQYQKIKSPETLNSGEKIQTYKEWKEAQTKRKMQESDEKPAQKENRLKPYTDKHQYHRDKIHSDEKLSLTHKQYPSYDPRNRPRHDRHKAAEQRDFHVTSPSYIKSPLNSNSPSASQSPLYYGNRKRTTSNNSDMSSSNKKVYREFDQSSNSNQSWATGGNSRDTFSNQS